MEWQLLYKEYDKYKEYTVKEELFSHIASYTLISIGYLLCFVAAYLLIRRAWKVMKRANFIMRKCRLFISRVWKTLLCYTV